MKPSKAEATKLKAEGKGRWKKFGNDWIWMEKIENTNPWDLDNTYVKMSCKRALIGATLNATAASDIFIQSIDDTSTKEENPDANEAPATIHEVSKLIKPSLKKLFHKKRLNTKQILEIWSKYDGNQDSILKYLTKQEAA